MLELHLGLMLVIQSCLLLLLVLHILVLLCWQCTIQLYMCGAEDGRLRRHTGTHAERASAAVLVAQAPVDPLTVTIVDRPYKAGRHILNVQELQTKIKAKWADSVVRVVHIEGMDLRQQIALFQHTSILIWTHGAAMADLLFLPQVLYIVLLYH